MLTKGKTKQPRELKCTSPEIRSYAQIHPRKTLVAVPKCRLLHHQSKSFRFPGPNPFMPQARVHPMISSPTRAIHKRHIPQGWTAASDITLKNARITSLFRLQDRKDTHRQIISTRQLQGYILLTVRLNRRFRTTVSIADPLCHRFLSARLQILFPQIHSRCPASSIPTTTRFTSTGRTGDGRTSNVRRVLRTPSEIMIPHPTTRNSGRCDIVFFLPALAPACRP